MKPVVRFLQIEAASGLVLLAATAAAILLANSRWAPALAEFWSATMTVEVAGLSLTYSLKHIVNDGLMTLFFFIVGLEIKREWVLGELREWHAAALPLAAAVGGMVVPAAIYFALQAGAPGERGWGIVMATDIAFVVGCLALLGRRVPYSLRLFVLSLAIIDDIGAVLVIALVYSADLNAVPLALGLAGVGWVVLLRVIGVRSIPVFFLAGALAWFAFDHSGIHPTLLGVALGLLTPVYPSLAPRRFEAMMGQVLRYFRVAAWKPVDEPKVQEIELLRSFAVAARETVSPLERLMAMLQPWVAFVIMPIFAFANAGVPISLESFGQPIVLAIVAGLVVGKPLGILGASWLAVRTRAAKLGGELDFALIAAAGVLCGIGFTMSLFIANLAFADGILEAATLGVLLASTLSAVLGLALITLAVYTRRSPDPELG